MSHHVRRGDVVLRQYFGLLKNLWLHHRRLFRLDVLPESEFFSASLTPMHHDVLFRC